MNRMHDVIVPGTIQTHNDLAALVCMRHDLQISFETSSIPLNQEFFQAYAKIELLGRIANDMRSFHMPSIQPHILVKDALNYLANSESLLINQIRKNYEK